MDTGTNRSKKSRVGLDSSRGHGPSSIEVLRQIVPGAPSGGLRVSYNQARPAQPGMDLFHQSSLQECHPRRLTPKQRLEFRNMLGPQTQPVLAEPVASLDGSSTGPTRVSNQSQISNAPIGTWVFQPAFFLGASEGQAQPVANWSSVRFCPAFAVQSLSAYQQHKTVVLPHPFQLATPTRIQDLGSVIRPFGPESGPDHPSPNVILPHFKYSSIPPFASEPVTRTPPSRLPETSYTNPFASVLSEPISTCLPKETSTAGSHTETKPAPSKEEESKPAPDPQPTKKKPNLKLGGALKEAPSGDAWSSHMSKSVGGKTEGGFNLDDANPEYSANLCSPVTRPSLALKNTSVLRDPLDMTEQAPLQQTFMTFPEVKPKAEPIGFTFEGLRSESRSAPLNPPTGQITTQAEPAEPTVSTAPIDSPQQAKPVVTQNPAPVSPVTLPKSPHPTSQYQSATQPVSLTPPPKSPSHAKPTTLPYIGRNRETRGPQWIPLLSPIAPNPAGLVDQPLIDPNPIISLRKVRVAITKKNRLMSLYHLLKRLFLNEVHSFTDIQGISDREFAIFRQIIHKKTGVTLERPEALLDGELSAKILLTFNQNSTKRKEENCEFIFKSVLKRMMRIFEARFELQQDENVTFYKHYFGTQAVATGIAVEAYWDPTSQRIPGKEHSQGPFKSINHNYLKQVFAAPSFREDFLRVLASRDFVQVCREKVGKKLAKLMNKWDKELKQPSDDNFVRKIVDYFSEAKRCKLPWTLYEVETARKSFIKELEFSVEIDPPAADPRTGDGQ